MSKQLPYLAAPGTITTALNRIRDAATPPRFTADFVASVLNMKGGSGAAIIPLLKKLNFVSSDGVPTEAYKNFRNITIAGQIMADAIKHCYQPLMQANEYFYKLSDTDLRSLIIQVSGLDAKDNIVKLILSTLNNLKEFADFDNVSFPSNNIVDNSTQQNNDYNKESIKSKGNIGVNLGYTINIHLPATTDQEVFNAIFKSLKEHLLTDE